MKSGQKNATPILVRLNDFIPLIFFQDLALKNTYRGVPMVNNFHFLLIIGILIPFALYGQTEPTSMPNYEKEHFSQREGLTHRYIIDIKKGPSGRLWVTTRQGLNYFDGNNFTKVLAHRKLNLEDWQFQRVRLVRDNSGNLIGIPAFRWQYFPPFFLEDSEGKLSMDFLPIEEYQLEEQSLTKNHCFLCFFYSEKGRKTLDLISSQLGLDEKETENLFFWEFIDKFMGVRLKSGQHDIDIISEMNDGSYVIWVPGNGYLWVNASFTELTQIAHPDAGDPSEFWSGNLPLDAQNLFWYPSYVEDGELKFSNFSLPTYLDLENAEFKVDAKGGIYVYIKNQKGLIYKSEDGGVIDLRAKIPGRITSIYPDEDGLLWIGTQNGLFRLRFPGELFTKIGALPFTLNNPAPIGNSIRNITEGQAGNFYANNFHGSAYFVDKKNQYLQPLVEKYPDGSPIQILQMKSTQLDDRAYLLIGTPSGLFVHCLNKDSLFQPISSDEGISELITGIYRDKKEGHYRLINEANQHFTLAINGFKIEKGGRIPEKMLQPLLLTDGILYGNTKEGLGKYHLEKGEFKEVFQLQSSREIDHWDIRSAILTESELWLGTFEGLYGLDRYTYEVKFHIDKEGGLPGEIIYNMVFDGEGFWLGTENGLSYLEPESSFIKSFFEWDGLSHREFNTGASLLDSKGRIWMGGLNGINFFEPGEVKSVNFPVARLYLNEVEIFDTRDETTRIMPVHRYAGIENMYFSPTENSLQFKLSHLNLSRTGGSTYSWYLEGYESPWANRTKLNEIWYRNMSPGNYTLRVRATDYRGVHSENELTIPFIINQYWYMRGWAVILWIALLVTLLFLVTRYLYNRKMERHRLLQLQELDLQKTKLYTNITHEFKTPLTVILGLADRSKKMVEESNRELYRMQKTISQNGNQLLHLVNQMMAMARIESSQLKVTKQPVQTVAFLKHLCQSFQSLASQKGITIETQLEGSESDFHLIDSKKLQQIVSNLLSNAIKFSPEDSRIRITAGIETTKTEENLYFSIQDSGPGVPKGEMDKVFDRFYRVQSDLTNNTPGTGIGLALAKELVEMMGGIIHVVENEEIGANFFFSIPLEKTAPPQSSNGLKTSTIDQLQLEQTLAGTTVTSTGKIENENPVDSSSSELPLILLVEDHLDVHRYIKSCIPDKYRTISAMNGLEGHELAIEKVPDLIISDVMMPEMDGYSMCEKLKTHRATSHIPILLLTAKSDSHSRLTGLKHGADAYLAKPFDREELLLRIDNMFSLIQKMKQRLCSLSLSSGEKVEESAESTFLKEFHSVMEKGFREPNFGTSHLCEAMHLSRSQLYRKIKALTDESPSVLLKKFRIEKGHEMLTTYPEMSISEVAYSTGFSSGKYFSEVYLEQFGSRPRTDATAE